MKVTAFLLNSLEDLNLIPCVKVNLLRYPDAVRRATPPSLPCVDHEDDPLLATAVSIDDVEIDNRSQSKAPALFH
jgi:hypothetical protein